MPLGYGAITFSQIRNEFSGPVTFSSYYRGGGYVPYNDRNVNINTGVVGLRMSTFRGASRVVPGSAGYGVGYHGFVVPHFGYIIFDIRAGGGGGGGSTYDWGAPGGAGAYGENSSISTGIYATGGAGGEGSYFNSPGKAPNGSGINGNYYNAYGEGGGGGPGGTYGITVGGTGGDGGRAMVIYYEGQLTVGSTIGLSVGNGGAGGDGQAYGGSGAGGAIYVSWGV